MRRLWCALLLALALAQPLALAQQPELQPEACRAPIVEVEEPPPSFDPGSTISLLMSIENPNRAPVENVRATVTTTAPAGWTAVAAQRELTLGPQNSTISALAVTSPNRGSGAGSGNVTILITFVCTSGDIETSASATKVMPVQIAAFNAPWPLVLSAFAILATGVTILGIRRLRRSVAIVLSAGGEREVSPGKSVKFTFVVENRRGKPQRLTIVPEGVPEGWSIHLALTDIELEPGEEKALWAILKAPPLAATGADASVTLHLEDARGARGLGSTTLRARVAAAP